MQLAIGVGHHGRAAFLTTDRDLYIGIVQAVQYRKIAFSGNAENVVDTLGDKLINKDMPAHAGVWGSGGRCSHSPSA